MPDDSRSSGTVATLGMGHMDNDTDRIMYDFRLVEHYGNRMVIFSQKTDSLTEF